MSSRTRTMGAGLAGSTTRQVNVNQIQFGDKLQGLAPSATQFFIQPGKGGGNNYQTRADGDRRNFVFCMNQLGGVGRAKSQFKIDGVNQPDGTGNCVAGPYSLQGKIDYLKKYFLGLLPDYALCLVGERELISTDLEGCPCMDSVAVPASGDPFLHLTDSTYTYTNQSLTQRDIAALAQALTNNLVRSVVTYVNSQCSHITGTGCLGQDLGTHTLGLVPSNLIATLNACGYGLTQWNTIPVYAGASGSCTGWGHVPCYHGSTITERFA